MSAATPLTAPAPAPISLHLETARHHHAHGQLLQAAEAYRRALATDPHSQAALLALSLIARQSRQLPSAIKMAQAALAAGPNSAIAWANYGDLLAAVCQPPQAQTAYRRAIALDASVAAAHFGLGNLLALQEDFPAALTSFQTASNIAPNIAEIHFARGFAHSKLGAHSEAIAAYRRAITLRPGFASAWLNLGVELIADGRDQLAALCYSQALKASPQNTHTQISALLNLGHLERNRRRYTQAREHYDRALALTSPTHLRCSEIQVSFTYLHLEQKQFPEAWQSLRLAEAAQAANPKHKNSEIANARGILLLAELSATANPYSNPDSFEEKITQAIAAFEEAESQGHTTAPSNRGNALLRLGRCEEALAAHESAVNLAPHHPGAQYNRALTQLRLGDYAHGWPSYEIRWSFREVHPLPHRFRQPRWQGEPLGPSARLFLYAEQGLGDTMQFVRYLPLVVERLSGSHLILAVQAPLTRLLAASIARLTEHRPSITTEIIVLSNHIPVITHHCPLMSLPAVFQTTLQTVPNAIPYLESDPQLTYNRAREFPQFPNLRPIGIAWTGNPNYRADHERSTSLETFLPLLHIPNIRWISLQKGEAANEIPATQQTIPAGCTLLDGCSSDRDFADTAALIANLDLVITTDTAVAHLAGALGKPLWLLLPWQSDWRWMQSRATTPWYPTARLFRQPSPNNWPELIRCVAHQLALPPKSPSTLL
ncbi:tetratricopeptide repeat protein [Acidicapsa acidisoli]|uniref:tetratricopeptide repeat protein n=1 Tax=Acidicapsa acidisoli TaxID=1615681 RepID=UPI0021E01C0B|nr:tetratricopeptide repeat protein [Acidicapsa acidisoli]